MSKNDDLHMGTRSCGYEQKSKIARQSHLNKEYAQGHISLLELFDASYRLVYASTPRLQKSAFRLRYLVYCVQNNFERRDAFPDGLERDEFDPFSEHFLVQEKLTGDYVGTIRLIRPHNRLHPHGTPMQKFCHHAFFDQRQFDCPGHYSEISRLAVHCGNRVSLLETLGEKTQRERVARLSYSLVSIALAYCAAARICLDEELTHAYSMMEPKLAILLRRMGLQFERRGRPVQYHGLRAPYVWIQKPGTLTFNDEQRALFDYVLRVLKKQIRSE